MAVIRMTYTTYATGWARYAQASTTAPALLPSAPSAAGAKNLLSRLGLRRNRRVESLPPVCCAQHGVPFELCRRLEHRPDICFDCGEGHSRTVGCM